MSLEYRRKQSNCMPRQGTVPAVKASLKQSEMTNVVLAGPEKEELARENSMPKPQSGKRLIQNNVIKKNMPLVL